MFGSSGSPPKEGVAESRPVISNSPPKSTLSPSSAVDTLSASAGKDDTISGEKRSGHSPRRSSGEPTATGEKKRRSSGVGSKASSLLASAKNSLHFSPNPNSAAFLKVHDPQNSQTPLQKLGKHDPALSVPQGQYNNSAGESHPGPRSTFRVGVWEDRNKKCRRTMEDTHAFLYNFLHTPAPVLKSESTAAISDSSEKSTDTLPNTESSSSLALLNSSTDMLETDNGYFAIFDGHAGTFAADWCGKKLHIILEDMIKKNPNTSIPELLDQTFTTVDAQLEKLPLKNSGCTAVIAVLRWEDRIPNTQSATGSTAIAPATAAAVKAQEDAAKSENAVDPSKGTPQQSNAAAAVPRNSISSNEATHAKLRTSATRQRVLYTANVGDARIILCRNGKALRLSYDHKGSDENEGKRIANAGGLILNNRVNGVLAVTRALGDAYMKDLVTGHPYTTETVIQPDLDEFIILACDGLWDVCTDQEAVDLVRNVSDPVQASKMLVEYALARFSTDNLSCMIVRFNKVALMDSVNHKTPAIGVEGDLGSEAGRASEVDKILGDARRKVEAGGDGMGVSGSNSGRGHDSKLEDSGAGSERQSMQKVVEEEPSLVEGDITNELAPTGNIESSPDHDARSGAEAHSPKHSPIPDP